MFLPLCCCCYKTKAVILLKSGVCHQRKISTMVLVLCNIPDTQQLSALEENKQNEVSCLFSMFQHPSICLPLYSQSLSHNFSYLLLSKIWLIFSHNRPGESREVFFIYNEDFSCPGSPASALVSLLIKKNGTRKMSFFLALVSCGRTRCLYHN